MDTIEIIEQETPAYTVIDLVAADEQEAYSMIDEAECCPDCKAMPNNPRRSNDGLLGIATGIFANYAVSYKTQAEAAALMLTDNWKLTEEV